MKQKLSASRIEEVLPATRKKMAKTAIFRLCSPLTPEERLLTAVIMQAVNDIASKQNNSGLWFAERQGQYLYDLFGIQAEAVEEILKSLLLWSEIERGYRYFQHEK